jgi:hypothetical protein
LINFTTHIPLLEHLFKMMKNRALALTAADGLDNQKRVQLLEVIDHFRELGVSENVSLPQVRITMPPFFYDCIN